MATLSPVESDLFSLLLSEIFFTNNVIDQNIKRMVAELDSADKRLIQTATSSGAAKKEESLPNTMNNGAPGGCPTSSLYAAVMYSPQSHKLTVSSRVMK